MGGLLSTEISSHGGPHPGRSSMDMDCKQFLREANGRLTDFYQRIRDLGEGAYGEVFLARQRIQAGSDREHEGRLCAVKRVRKPNVEAGLDEEGADSMGSSWGIPCGSWIDEGYGSSFDLSTSASLRRSQEFVPLEFAESRFFCGGEESKSVLLVEVYGMIMLWLWCVCMYDYVNPFS